MFWRVKSYRRDPTMRPAEIIAIMRSRGWLRTEPADTRERITSSVRYLLVKNGMTVKDLAGEIGGVAVSYIRQKVSDHRWRLEDLDTLEDAFAVPVSDIVAGYRRLEAADSHHTPKDTKHAEY